MSLKLVKDEKAGHVFYCTICEKFLLISPLAATSGLPLDLSETLNSKSSLEPQLF